MATSSHTLPNSVIGQAGGPTAVINQSLVGIVETLRGQGGTGKILGARHAVNGIVDGDFIELQDLPQDRMDRLARTPSAALGSSRVKPDEADRQRILNVLEQNNVRFFFYIGGNDSAETCRLIGDLAHQSGYDLCAFHVPKTIDNDLVHNDHTPGFGSAAKFVIQAVMGDDLDNRALPGIKIEVVMGRHSGFLTAAAVLARQQEGDGPHLIYVPEVAFDVDRFVADVDRVYTRHGRCVIVVSESIRNEDNTPMITRVSESVERDAHGNVQLSGTGALADFLLGRIRDSLGKSIRVRADTFGYLQRSFAGCVSAVDAAEAREAGRTAARCALSGGPGGSIAIQRVSDDPYEIKYSRLELADVAAKTRTLDPDFVVDGNDIHDRFRDYLAPIVGDLPVVESLRV